MTGNRLVVGRDRFPDLEEPMACPGTGVRGWETENKPINKIQIRWLKCWLDN